MNLSLRLISFRKYKCWQAEDVAISLGLSLESYMDIEKGHVRINDTIRDKLSNLYQVPKEIFIVEEYPCYMQAEVIYTNCNFISGSCSSNGYTNHQYNDRGIDEILFSKKEEIKRLQNEIDNLYQHNARLIELLGEKIANTI